MTTIKLTKKQREIIADIRGGMQICTSSEVKGAWISGLKSHPKEQYHINNGIFWRLVKDGLIYQQLGYPFQYQLTELGKSIEL